VAVTATAPSSPSDGELEVAIAPWCDLTVDGADRGRTPVRLRLAAGAHAITCVNSSSGARLERAVTIEAGRTSVVHERLYQPARVSPRLTRGDAFSIDGGTPAAGAREIAPGRRKVILYAGGRQVDSGYVDVAPGGCRLVDAPALACKP
jgi:hypothetical protein